MQIFDTHSHLNDRRFKDDFDKVLDRMDKNGVVGAVVVGIDIKSSLKAINLAKNNSNLLATVGIHPHNSNGVNDKDIKTLENYVKKNRDEVVAIGEIGLDFNRMKAPEKIQEKVMIKQIELAKKVDLPIIFHERDTKGRFLKMLDNFYNTTQKGVVHCFGGTKNELEKYLEKDLYIGITGIVTLQERGKYLQSLIKNIPNNKLLIETDCPYLTPFPQKKSSRRNEPSFLNSTLKKIAELKKIDIEELSEIIFNNSLKFFNLLEE